MRKTLCILLICCICIPFSYGQSDDVKDFRKGPMLGVGFGFNNYYTSWYYVEVYFDDYYHYYYHYPYHNFSRQGIFAEFEMRSLFNLSIIHFDADFDFFFGFAGNTKEDWDTYDKEVISSGGATYSAGLLFKIAVPLMLGSNMAITPYTGIGFQFTGLESNGKDVSENVSSRYYYQEGWFENVYGASLPLGLEFELNKLVFSAEYRMLIAGGASTDWDPKGREVQQEDRPKMNSISIGIGFKL